MYNTVGETAGVTQDVGSDPTVGDPFHNRGGHVSRISRGGEDAEEDFTCTYCGDQLEDEFVQLSVSEGGKEEVILKEPKLKIQTFDLGEMSCMEDEENDVDGEPDNGRMDEVDGEEVEHSQRERPIAQVYLTTAG